MKASHFLILCFLVVTFSHQVTASNYPRQGVKTDTTSASQPAQTTTTTTTSSAASTPDPPQTPSSTPSSTLSSSTESSTKTPDPTNTSKTSAESTQSQTQSQQTSVSPVVATSLSTSTDSNGAEVTVTLTTTSSTSASSTAPSSTTTKKSDDSSSFGTGSIIGVSVAGGVALIAIIAFFVWKFTRKRFTDFDDSEAIKWPELNTHGGTTDSHPLPVHNTGRAGFDTGSEVSLSRVPSTSNYSTPDVGGVGADPYAVPPLPHMNPNQPYRDDPTGTSGYYDPYRGPIPGTIEHGVDDYGEAIPMTQMASGAQGGRMSPGPQAAYRGGRASPGPQAAYGGGRASPGPHAAYTAGRMSPGPQASYDLYGGR